MIHPDGNMNICTNCSTQNLLRYLPQNHKRGPHGGARGNIRVHQSVGFILQNISIKLHSKPSNCCWDISVTGIHGALLPSWLKITDGDKLAVLSIKCTLSNKKRCCAALSRGWNSQVRCTFENTLTSDATAGVFLFISCSSQHPLPHSTECCVAICARCPTPSSFSHPYDSILIYPELPVPHAAVLA